MNKDDRNNEPEPESVDETNAPPLTPAQVKEAEELRQKIAEIERKVADGN
ncbi:hypothetical protein JFU37_00720 [Pseudomonas sp. TH41]|nr:hypothetical protein [Pseudomonas sp. TH41]MBK5351054.1 hypothetical protein [Pseudomonas sp. TH41]